MRRLCHRPIKSNALLGYYLRLGLLEKTECQAESGYSIIGNLKN